MEHGWNGHCCVPMCKGAKLIALGVILIANEYYFGINWWLLAGGLLMVKGLAVMVMKGCVCYQHCEIEEKKPHKKK